MKTSSSYMTPLIAFNSFAIKFVICVYIILLLLCHHLTLTLKLPLNLHQIFGRQLLQTVEPSIPEFVNSIPNLSIIAGKDAVMRCSVKNLGNRAVSWHHLDSKSHLTIGDQVLTQNPRIQIHKDESSYLLFIYNVSLEDKGYYMCQINWHQPKSQLGYLNVVVPPRFDKSTFKSGSNITVQEFENVTLSCSAKGNPPPRIRWKQEDDRVINNVFIDGKEVTNGGKVLFGERLSFIPVTRWATGSYLCIASNGISSSISRRLILTVHFAPVIKTPVQKVTAIRGENLTLECLTESSPLAQHHWLNVNGEKIDSNKTQHQSHYTINMRPTYHFKVIYQLTIHSVNVNDSGKYACHVGNHLGQARSIITLRVIEFDEHRRPNHMLPPPTTPTFISTMKTPFWFSSDINYEEKSDDSSLARSDNTINERNTRLRSNQYGPSGDLDGQQADVKSKSARISQNMMIGVLMISIWLYILD